MSKNKFGLNDTLADGEKWLPERPAPRRVVQDTKLIRWECYNRHQCTLTFTRMDDMVPYILQSGIDAGPKVVICKPEGFAILNHSFYVITASDGRELIDIQQNVGRFIGIGNKHPHRPMGG